MYLAVILSFLGKQVFFAVICFEEKMSRRTTYIVLIVLSGDCKEQYKGK